MKREIRLENLYLDYGKERFLNWCRTLYSFRFIKSHSYPDDMNPDRFIALINFKDEDELRNFVNIMKIESDVDIQEAITSESYFSGKAKVNETTCYIEINKVLKNLVFVVSGTEEDQFALDDSTFQRAKKIDQFLSELNMVFVSSPYDDVYSITPEFYPSVWNKEH
ncbi:MAG: hypothetical protein HGN29_07705 [Asgard group archaeon]|nr:hypothetical protein [Asgard group archaeon]